MYQILKQSHYVHPLYFCVIAYVALWQKSLEAPVLEDGPYLFDLIAGISVDPSGLIISSTTTKE